MSNHFSAADFKSPGGDARLDLTDLFVFASPDDPGKTVLIMDANPFTHGDGFHPDAVYRFNIDTLRGTLVSDQAWQASWNLAVTASATAAVACIGTWTTDFRDDLAKIDVPMLVIHGDADQVLPLDKTASRLPDLIKDMHLVVVEGAPHAIAWTHAGQVNTALLDFLRT